jgi:hypothetical protein
MLLKHVLIIIKGFVEKLFENNEIGNAIESMNQSKMMMHP